MPMSALAGLARFIKGKGAGGVHIDNRLFQLHYRVTTTIFLGASALLCTSSLFGSPVNCHHSDPDRISKDVINTYCWVTSTYTLPHQLAKADKYPFSDIPFQGVGTHSATDEKKYHGYYQWVAFVLFLQGMAFYVPHWLWRVAEGRRLSSLLQQTSVPVLDAEDRARRLSNTVQYLQASLGSYNGYFYRYCACELLNCINVVANIFITDRFLNGDFLSYGPRALAYFSGRYGNRASPMTETFPKLTKCNFQLVGSSGSVQSIDSICVMALNILNEKVYLLLWFWLLTLALRSTELVNPRDLEDVAQRVRLGDFFLFCMMAKNMDAVAFSQLMAELSHTLTKKPAGEGTIPRAPPIEHTPGQTLVKRNVSHTADAN
ncbi:Innexin inx2 [Amphibalanus amphitrite]|uniref:Innexin n=1 Tax=Amphibalanus amphitrite TaxID=1232801 RepID=A0A6A4V3T3_AMPAM|nr:Innexin inx2 [Amphibalanus amphitrite]